MSHMVEVESVQYRCPSDGSLQLVALSSLSNEYAEVSTHETVLYGQSEYEHDLMVSSSVGCPCGEQHTLQIYACQGC